MAVCMPVCLLLFLLFATALGESSIRARANLPVFQFFSRTGHHVLDEEIPKITIPEVSIPIEGGPGHGKVTAKNMKIVKFQSPKFDFTLLRDGLQWISRGGAIKIGGDWQAEYTALIPISESGWMKAFASNIRVQLSAGLYPKEGRPQVNIGSCTADIGQLDIEIGGGVLPWLVNLFRTPISAAIKDQIHKQACTSAKDILLVEANDFLHALPLHIPLGSNFYVDYIFDQKPKITRYVCLPHAAKSCYSPYRVVDKSQIVLDYFGGMLDLTHTKRPLYMAAGTAGAAAPKKT